MVGKIHMTATPKQFDRSEGAKRDIIAGGIVVAAILLFVGTGSNVMQAAVRALIGIGGGPDRALAAALVLNIALILFGWRRYEDLNREIRERTEAEQRARYLADTDPLTGFLNRRALLATGQQMIAGAIAEKRQVALFLLDLDGLNISHESMTPGRMATIKQSGKRWTAFNKRCRGQANA